VAGDRRPHAFQDAVDFFLVFFVALTAHSSDLEQDTEVDRGELTL
jgi:hypothetical protein